MSKRLLRRLAVLVLCGLFGGSAFAAPAATAPSTAATTQPEAPLLYKGRLHYTPPAGWRFLPNQATDLTVAYSAPDGHAVMTLTLTPQQDAFMATDAVRREMAFQIVKGLKAALGKRKVQMELAPRAEPEERVFLKIHTRYHEEGDMLSDQTLYYRVVGPELVMVVVGAKAEKPEEAKPYQEAAIDLLLSANLQHAPRVPRGRGAASAGGESSSDSAKTTAHAKRPAAAPQPRALAKARIRLTAPAGWTAMTQDVASGLVATYRHPANKPDLIIVSVRPLPREARTDPKLREAILDEMVEGESASLKLEEAKAVGEVKKVTDPRFLRHTRRVYDANGTKLQVDSRQVLAGETLVSVTSLALQAEAARVNQPADHVALSIRPLPRAVD